MFVTLDKVYSVECEWQNPHGISDKSPWFEWLILYSLHVQMCCRMCWISEASCCFFNMLLKHYVELFVYSIQEFWCLLLPCLAWDIWITRTWVLLKDLYNWLLLFRVYEMCFQIVSHASYQLWAFLLPPPHISNPLHLNQIKLCCCESVEIRKWRMYSTNS